MKPIRILTKHFLLLRILFLLPYLQVFGFQSVPADSLSILSFADKMIVKLNLDTYNDRFSYRDNESQEALKIANNNDYRLFLSLDYEFIGISLGFTPEFLEANRDQALKGDSDFTDLQFRMFLGSWVQGLQMNKVKGYYVLNTSDFIPDWEEGRDPFLQFETLGRKSWGGFTGYVFNPHFSYRNVVYQTEWQRRSAGSFIPQLHYNYTIFKLESSETEATDRYFDLTLSPAYYQTFVLHKNWFLSLHLSPSVGMRWLHSENQVPTGFEEEKTSLVLTALETGLQIGYSSERVILGSKFFIDDRWYRDTQGKTQNDQFYLLFYAGYRFDTPSFIRKITPKF